MRKPKIIAAAKVAPAVSGEAVALASRYGDMTDTQIMEVMHGEPQIMLSDVKALAAAVLDASKA